MLRTFKPSQGKFGDGNKALVYLTMGVTVSYGSMSLRRYGTSHSALIPKIVPTRRVALEVKEQLHFDLIDPMQMLLATQSSKK